MLFKDQRLDHGGIVPRVDFGAAHAADFDAFVKDRCVVRQLTIGNGAKYDLQAGLSRTDQRRF